MPKPLLQQPHRAAVEGEAFCRDAALEIAQENRAVPGPLHAVQVDTADAVGNDSGVDAEQQLVADHHLGVGEQRRADMVQAAVLLADLPDRPAVRQREFRSTDGTPAGQ